MRRKCGRIVAVNQSLRAGVSCFSARLFYGAMPEDALLAGSFRQCPRNTSLAPLIVGTFNCANRAAQLELTA
jgi:hypothetical protein